MEDWLFVDMETLGTDTHSKILSMGLLFVPSHLRDASEDVLYERGIHILLDVDAQRDRSVNKSTIAYWEDQIKSGLASFNGRKWTPEQAYAVVRKYLEINNFDSQRCVVWSRGLFDKFLWTSLYGVKSEIIPHFLWRDSLTALDILTGSTVGTVSTKRMKKHDALYNCVFEFKRLREAEKLYD